MIRKANIKDVKQIHKLINYFAAKDLMIARSLNELYENIRDFWVYEEKSKVVGCAALHVVGWQELAEIKSLAVEKRRQRKGIGKSLVLKCLEEASTLAVKKVFCLTYLPEFFMRFGFKKIDKSKLPHKVWIECCNCPKFPDCKEIALVKEI
ncbi:MAG: N-acetyltransferase [Candidatus Omnitrophica bacterium]|nr:N-acetyltransferase [Candidatus Omnitrophota bacterium]